MVACTSSSDLDFEETLNTLKYAHRARNIKNKPVVNHDPKQAQLAAMQDEIEALRSALQRASETSPVPVVPVVPEDFPVGEAPHQNYIHRLAYCRLKTYRACAQAIAHTNEKLPTENVNVMDNSIHRAPKPVERHQALGTWPHHFDERFPWSVLRIIVLIFCGDG